MDVLTFPLCCIVAKRKNKMRGRKRKRRVGGEAYVMMLDSVGINGA